MKADLHIHSSCSDGTDTPEAIVVKAKEYGIGAIAVTDHDSVDGVERAVAAGRKNGVQVVPGLELSTYSIAEVHILGYDVDVHSAELCERLERMRVQRKERICKILDNLAAMGVKTELSGDCLAVYGGGLHPFAAKGMGDHRMVMSAAVAALACSGEVTDAEAVGKSYPAFFDDLKTLGGNVNESL